MAPEVLDLRLASLKELLGEQRLPQAIANSPSLLCLLPNTPQNKMAMLTSFGLNAHTTVKRHPMILSRSEHAIRSRLTFFEESGLDAVRIINAKPHVLCYDIQRTLLPIIQFITKDMGRTLDDINKCPRCFSASLEQRLKPRHEYLKLYGKRQDYSLGVICGFTDERFASLTDPKKRPLPSVV